MYLHTAPLFLKPCLIDPWGGNSVSMGLLCWLYYEVLFAMASMNALHSFIGMRASSVRV